MMMNSVVPLFGSTPMLVNQLKSSVMLRDGQIMLSVANRYKEIISRLLKFKMIVVMMMVLIGNNASSQTMFFIWNGNTSTDWNTGSNWNLGTVPNALNHSVEIPNTMNKPVISSDEFHIQELIMNDPLSSLIMDGGMLGIHNTVYLNAGSMTLNNDAILTCYVNLVLGSNFILTLNDNSFSFSSDETIVNSGSAIIINDIAEHFAGLNTTINAGASVTLNDACFFTANAGFTNNGTLAVNGTSRLDVTTTTFILAGPSTFSTGSVTELDGAVVIPTLPAPGYGNLILNANVGTFTLAGDLFIASDLIHANGSTFSVNTGSGMRTVNIGDDYYIFSLTGIARTNLVASATAQNTTMNIGGNLYVERTGRINLESISSATGSGVINIAGNFISTGTSVAASGANGVVNFGTGTNTNNAIYIGGNFSKSGTGTFGTSPSGSTLGFVFNKTGAQTFSYAGANSQFVQYVVSPNSTLQMLTSLALLTSTLPTSTFTVQGTLEMGLNQITSTADALFSLTSGATLKTSHANGITGAISGFGARATYHNASNYEFTGSAAITNTNFVNTTMNNLKINNSNSVTLGSLVNINGDLNLSAGTFAAGTNLITLGGNITGTATHTNTGAGNITMTGSNKSISGATLGNLVLNNAIGFSLAGSPTVKTLNLAPSTILNVNLPNVLTVH